MKTINFFFLIYLLHFLACRLPPPPPNFPFAVSPDTPHRQQTQPHLGPAVTESLVGRSVTTVLGPTTVDLLTIQADEVALRQVTLRRRALRHFNWKAESEAVDVLCFCLKATLLKTMQ